MSGQMVGTGITTTVFDPMACASVAAQSDQVRYCDSPLTLKVNGRSLQCNSPYSSTLARLISGLICPDSHPVDNGDGTCGASSAPGPEPHQCPEAGTFYKNLMGGDSIAGFSTCLPSNCVITIQKANLHVCYPNGDGSSECAWDLFYTGQTCNYDPNKPGLKPPKHEWPEDPVEKPDPEQPDITDLPDTGGGGEGGGEGGGKDPIYDPDGEEKPEDPVEKPNPDPKPDPDDPELGKGDNAIVGELSESNQWLENIDSTLEDLTNTTKLDNDTLLKYQANLLGELKAAHDTLKNRPTGGGGGGNGNGEGDGEGDCEEDCTPVAFPGAPEVKDPFEEILDQADIDSVLTRTEEVKTKLQAQVSNFKGLFRVPNYGTGGSIAPVEFNLDHHGTNIPVKFGIFSLIAPEISSIIIMIAAFICFLIVTTRR